MLSRIFRQFPLRYNNQQQHNEWVYNMQCYVNLCNTTKQDMTRQQWTTSRLMHLLTRLEHQDGMSGLGISIQMHLELQLKHMKLRNWWITHLKLHHNMGGFTSLTHREAVWRKLFTLLLWLRWDFNLEVSDNSICCCLTTLNFSVKLQMWKFLDTFFRVVFVTVTKPNERFRV